MSELPTRAVEQALAQVEPLWSLGPVQLLEVAVVEAGGRVTAWRAEEWDHLVARVAAWNAQVRETWRKGGETRAMKG